MHLPTYVDRVSHDAKPWKYHLDDTTLKNYTYPLHNLAFAILESMSDSHPSAYKFPLTLQMKMNGKELKKVLAIRGVNAGDVDIFHTLLYLFPSQDPSTSKHNKWSMVMECWLAVYNMQPQGNFSSAYEFTRLLSMLEYLCQGATFYKSYLVKDLDFGRSLYVLVTPCLLHLSKLADYDIGRALTHYCGENLHAGVLHPFNTIIEYQRFASSIMKTTGSPPTTTLSRDALIVTYKDKTMVLENWITGMRRMYDDAQLILIDLCGGEECVIDFPDTLIDDMSNTTYGYSWISKATM
jgi:hypothetical protein